MNRIRSYELSDDIFDKILYDFQKYIKIVPSTNPYIHGYGNKKEIYYDGKEYMIIREYILNYYCNTLEYCTEWKQCRVRRVQNTNFKISNSLDGETAWEFMLSLLEHWYTWDEIKERLNMFQAEYNKAYKQFHYTYKLEVGELKEFDNGYKYDINGAHTDALMEIFPKASKSILKLYEHRKEHPNNKNLINFFVGMIKRKGFEKTYNWIVQRTTKSLFNAMDITEGHIIYANTDGYVISSPKAQLEASSKLGAFKLEYTGKVYVYKDKNYWIIQTGDEIKGSCLKSVRKYIDLRIGSLVHYDRKRIPIANDDKGNPVYIITADNIIKETKECHKEELW